MKFNIKYAKLAYHFFYLRNMSMGWPFCHKEYNDAWLKITGDLTLLEKKAIKELKIILQKNHKNYWEILNFIFNKNKLPDNKKIKEIFFLTEKKFEKIWINIEKDLPLAKINLERLINKNAKNTKKIIEKIKIFYNADITIKNTKIYIILLPKTVKSAGGKFIPKNNVVLEGNINRFTQITIFEILIHEMIHLYFEDYLKQTLYPKFSKQIDYHKLKEIIATSLIPKGYLSHHFLKERLNSHTKEFSLIKLAEKYIESNKPIDNFFIKECIKNSLTSKR